MKTDAVISAFGDDLKRGSEKQFQFTALKNPHCRTEEVFKTMEELKEAVYYQRTDIGLTEEEAKGLSDKLMMYCMQILDDRKISYEITTDEVNHYFLKTLLALQRHDPREALRNMLIYESYGEIAFRTYPHLYYYKALALYELKQYEQAQSVFQTYCEYDPCNEIGHFYLGNVFFHKQEYQNALEEYFYAIKFQERFTEVYRNIALIAERLGDEGLKREILGSDLLGTDAQLTGSLTETPFKSTLAIDDYLDIWDIPIFINSYNRLGTLKLLVSWLLDAGYRKIYILDNDSTYPPLLEYYETLNKHEKYVWVLYLRKNWGHKAIWLSGILNRLHIDGPYAYTDSDVVPWEGCRKDFLLPLLNILRKYPLLKKVGLGLKTDDITYFDADKTREMEKRFYLYELEPEVYFGAVDTTMALYRNYRHYHLYVSARTTGDLMARHMPWYYDYDNLPEDERYYMDHANSSASLVESLKKR